MGKSEEEKMKQLREKRIKLEKDKKDLMLEVAMKDLDSKSSLSKKEAAEKKLKDAVEKYEKEKKNSENISKQDTDVLQKAVTALKSQLNTKNTEIEGLRHQFVELDRRAKADAQDLQDATSAKVILEIKTKQSCKALQQDLEILK